MARLGGRRRCAARASLPCERGALPAGWRRTMRTARASLAPRPAPIANKTLTKQSVSRRKAHDPAAEARHAPRAQAARRQLARGGGTARRHTHLSGATLAGRPAAARRPRTHGGREISRRSWRRQLCPSQPARRPKSATRADTVRPRTAAAETSPNLLFTGRRAAEGVLNVAERRDRPAPTGTELCASEVLCSLGPDPALYEPLVTPAGAAAVIVLLAVADVYGQLDGRLRA